MAGEAKRIIDKIISQKSQGNEVIASSTRTKLILKGINVKNINDSTPDDPAIIYKLRQVAQELGIKI